jgi:Glycosyl transferase 4-like domain
VYGVTVADSAQSFLRGQLSFMVDAGWEVTLGCSPGRGLDILREGEGVRVVEITTPRDISPLADIKALIGWVRLIQRVHPDVLNVSTPKAGLIGAMAGWLLRVPKRVYVVRGLRLESERGLRRRLLLLMERLTIACSTDIVAVSDSLCEELSALGLTGRKQPVVLGHGSSNGVDAMDIQARLDRLDRSDVRNDLGVTDESTFLVAFIGRIRRVDRGHGHAWAEERSYRHGRGHRGTRAHGQARELGRPMDLHWMAERRRSGASGL